MNIDLPLTPQLDQFVREQLANGRFQSEGDVVRAALRLLADQSPSQEPLPARRNESRSEGLDRSSEPLSKEAWAEIRDRARVTGNDSVRNRHARCSPRGLLADIRSSINPEEIKEARSEMWSGFLHGGA